MTPLRPLVDPATYRGWAWLIVGGAVLMPYMMAGEVVRVLLGVGTAAPLTLPVQPLTYLLVLPAVAATGLVLPVRALLVATAEGMLGARVPPVRQRRDWPTRWRTTGWYTLQLAVGGLLSGVTLALVPFVGIVAVLPLLPTPERYAGDLLELGWQLWWGPVFGLPALVGLVYLVAGAAAGLRRLAPRVLGPSAADRLAAAGQRAERLATRNRLARELHDSVGHALSVVTIQAAAAREVLDHDPQFARRALTAVEETARRALADLDHALGVLRTDEPSPTAPSPDLADVADLLAGSGLTVAAALAPTPPDLPGGVSREAYRILQEALTNALRYGADRTAAVELSCDDDEGLRLTVTNPLADPPPAVPAGRDRRGHGLAGMAERVAALGGSLRTGPVAGRWRVEARLPLRWRR